MYKVEVSFSNYLSSNISIPSQHQPRTVTETTNAQEIYSASFVLVLRRFLVAMDLALEVETIVHGIQPSRGTGFSSAEGHYNQEGAMLQPAMVCIMCSGDLFSKRPC